jgi:hypothetical protein
MAARNPDNVSAISANEAALLAAAALLLCRLETRWKNREVVAIEGMVQKGGYKRRSGVGVRKRTYVQVNKYGGWCWTVRQSVRQWWGVGRSGGREEGRVCCSARSRWSGMRL